MALNFLVLAIGLLALTVSADKFVGGAAALARNFGVSPLLIGLTVVGMGTSMPEILVSVIASLEGTPGLAIGNAVGSNIANIALILGTTAVIAPLTFHSGLLRRELPILMVISVLAYILAFDGFGAVDGAILLVCLVVFMVWLFRVAKQQMNSGDPLQQEIEMEIPRDISTSIAWIMTIVGLIGLLLSSRALVWAAVNIAHSLGVSDLVIGLTIVAIGTSLPELASSITSVLKKEDDLAAGNVIGSNIFNLLAVYAMPGLIAPSRIDDNVLSRDFPVMLALTAALFALGYGMKNSHGEITRIEGALLLCAYATYSWLLYQSVVG